MYTITDASLLDLTTLRRLEQICFPQDAWPLLDLIAVLTFPGVVRLKAVQDGQMVGFIAGDPRPKQGLAWIATVGVLPEFRRQGIGLALLEACEARLDAPRIRLSVREGNLAALRMYELAGYQKVDTWRQYYNDGGNAIIMERQL